MTVCLREICDICLYNVTYLFYLFFNLRFIMKKKPYEMPMRLNAALSKIEGY